MKRQAIAEAMRDGITEEMQRDKRVFCIGEDIGVPGGWGGAFTVTIGLDEKFPGRILNTPIAELGFSVSRSAPPLWAAVPSPMCSMAISCFWPAIRSSTTPPSCAICLEGKYRYPW